MSKHTINATGDCVVGDEVMFERAVFTGSFRSPKFSHNETITGTIISDSYGDLKQQHTFTIQTGDGSKIRIKGRNLYRNGVMRKPWTDESEREEAQQEKHRRGNTARQYRELRREREGNHV